MSIEQSQSASNASGSEGGSNASGGDPATGDEEEGQETELPLDVVFDILKNRRRRLVLKYAREHEGQFTLSDVAEYIAAEENDKSVGQLTSDERKRVYVGLYQCHLPRMDDTGILDFDRNRGTIDMKESVAQLEPYLNTDDGSSHEWAVYYGGLTVLGVVLYVAAMLPVVPISLSVVTLVVLGGLGCCSVLQLVLGS